MSPRERGPGRPEVSPQPSRLILIAPWLERRGSSPSFRRCTGLAAHPVTGWPFEVDTHQALWLGSTVLGQLALLPTSITPITAIGVPRAMLTNMASPQAFITLDGPLRQHLNACECLSHGQAIFIRYLIRHGFVSRIDGTAHLRRSEPVWRPFNGASAHLA